MRAPRWSSFLELLFCWVKVSLSWITLDPAGVEIKVAKALGSVGRDSIFIAIGSQTSELHLSTSWSFYFVSKVYFTQFFCFASFLKGLVTFVWNLLNKIRNFIFEIPLERTLNILFRFRTFLRFLSFLKFHEFFETKPQGWVGLWARY